MVDRVVSVKVTADVNGAVAGFRRAAAAVDDLTKAASPKKAEAFKNLSDKMAVAGVGVAAGLALAVKRFADFDQSMSAVRANSGATGQELENLRQLAVKLGADSQFSAKEAADGINEMAKAGVSVQQIMGGGLKGALDLAAAGQIGVAEAAETAATAMTQFKLAGDDVPHIADLLANAANKAQGGVGDMAQALKQAGLVAASTGLSIEETTAGLTAFASAGLIGSDAGTAFKTMLQRLSAPTDEAAGQMKELGISAYDSQGDFVGLANVAGQLQSSMRDLTPEQRNAALAIIFGSDAIRAANVLYDEGADGINRWTAAVGEQGAAAKQAAELTDNLKGDLERLGGALDSVFIQTGSSANGGLRTLVQGITGFVDSVGKVPGPLLLVGGALTAFALLAPKGVIKFREYTAQLDTLGISLEKIAARGPVAAKGVDAVTRSAKGLAGAAVAATITYAAFDEEISSLGPNTLAKDLDAGGAALARINEQFRDSAGLAGRVDSGITDFGDAITAVFNPSVTARVDSALGTLKGFFGGTDVSNIAVASQRIGELDTALSAMATGGNANKAAQAFDVLARQAAAQGVSIDELKRKFPQYAEALAGAAREADVTTKAVAGTGSAATKAAANFTAAAADGNALASAMLLLGENADATSDVVKNLAKSIQSDMDGASKAFQSSFDVLGKFDPDKARAAAEAASAKVAESEQRAQDVRERIAAKRKKTIADTQAIERADVAVGKAKATEKEANARLESSGLTALYKDAVRDARAFTADIAEATKLGLDPQTIARLLQEGPEKAGPALEALLGNNSRNLIKMSNDAETELRKLNGVIVEQARLTSLAVNSTSDQMGRDLDAAMAIAAEKARLGGVATGQQIASGIGASKGDVERIAREFGIALVIPAPKPVQIRASTADGKAAIRDFKQELANLDGARVTTYIDTRIATERDRRQDAANSNTAGTLIRRAGGGVIPGYSPTPTADNILIRATAGEFMLRKASVDSIGKATLEYMNQHGRLPGYATGGLVAANVRPAPMRLMSGPSVTTHTENNSAPIFIDKFMGPTVQSLEAEAERRRRLENARAY